NPAASSASDSGITSMTASPRPVASPSCPSSSQPQPPPTHNRPGLLSSYVRAQTLEVVLIVERFQCLSSSTQQSASPEKHRDAEHGLVIVNVGSRHAARNRHHQRHAKADRRGR